MSTPRRYLGLFFFLNVFLAAGSGAAAPPYQLVQTFVDPGTNRPAGAQQGAAVALAGGLTFVGAPYDDAGAVNAGVVNIYNTSSGALLHTLTNPAPLASDFFGVAVAISGTRLVVGADQDHSGSNNRGLAYVYDLAATNPLLPFLALTNPAAGAQDKFGNAVAISGTRVVVGAWATASATNANAGAAYVYDLAGPTSTVPFLTLTNPAPSDGETDRFGFAVAIEGTKVVVGSPGGFNGMGGAYLYEVTNANPTLPVFVPINSATRAGNSRFGAAVGIAGSWIAIGAPFEASPDDSGSVFVYDLGRAVNTNAILELRSPTPQKSGHFGDVLAISGHRLVVGEAANDAGASNSGLVHVFDLTSVHPTTPLITLTNPSPEGSDAFGSAVAIDGLNMLCGALGDDTNGTDRGVAYLYAGLPLLRIAQATMSTAVVSWSPTNAPGFVLQYSDALSSTNWGNAASGATNPVTVPMTNAARFYRLALP